MSKIKFLFALCCLICLQSLSWAQIRIDAQLRNRFELRDGYKKLAADGANPTGIVSQRTRISFAYKSDLLTLNITPQDVRLWGGDASWSSSGVATNNSIGLFEGYAEIKTGEKLSIKVGRQAFKYDSQRMLAARNWNQNGLSHDALLLKFKMKEWNLHLAGTWNNLSDLKAENYYPSNRIKTLDFAWLNRNFNNNLTLSFLQLAAGTTDTDTTNTLNFRHTTGVYAQYTKGNFSAWGNAYYQYGKNTEAKAVSAFIVDFEACYKTGKLSPGIGLSYLSGNSKTGSAQTTDKLFDVHYGARHSKFGAMDYFSSFASQTQQGGLAHYFFFLDYQINNKVKINNKAQYFQLAQTNPLTPQNKNLGFENDLVLKYQFNEWGNLESGYCFFVPTGSLRTLQGVPNNKFSQFVYIQLTITPTLLK
jgi:hypothetical protein